MIFTQNELKAYITYDQESGDLHWLKRDVEHFKTWRSCCSWNGRFSGKKAGCIAIDRCGNTYIYLSIKNNVFRAHRLIWFFMTGYMPDEIDHINGNGLDNAWLNLREATRQENSRNRKLPSSNTSGFCGVSFSHRSNRWVAQIKNNRKSIYLGSFVSIDDAIIARRSAEKLHGFHENHGR